jgi:hypothetical protein
VGSLRAVTYVTPRESRFTTEAQRHRGTEKERIAFGDVRTRGATTASVPFLPRTPRFVSGHSFSCAIIRARIGAFSPCFEGARLRAAPAVGWRALKGHSFSCALMRARIGALAPVLKGHDFSRAEQVPQIFMRFSCARFLSWHDFSCARQARFVSRHDFSRAERAKRSGL